MPSMPLPARRATPRGVTDALEARGAFQTPSEQLTNKQLFFMNPMKDTSAAEKWRSFFSAPLPKPWEDSFDEALMGAPSTDAPPEEEASEEEEASGASKVRRHSK